MLASDIGAVAKRRGFGEKDANIGKIVDSKKLASLLTGSPDDDFGRTQ